MILTVEMPARIKILPVCPKRKVPIPWFVAMENGVPEFRCADHDKFMQALTYRLCWVCGQKLGTFVTFVTGPMAGMNRSHGEPPCHRDCAEYSARACPFLSRPNMERREAGMPEDIHISGEIDSRNPGVTLLWTTKKYTWFHDGKGGLMLSLGEPVAIDWYAEGKPATREQVDKAVAISYAKLGELALEDGPEAIKEIARGLEFLRKLFPKE